MLAVEKENLLAETNREIASLRETELRYYVDHIVSHWLDESLEKKYEPSLLVGK